MIVDKRLNEARNFIKNASNQLTALTQQLLLARCLYRIGRAGVGHDYLAGGLNAHLASTNAQDRFNAHIVMAHLCDAVSKYDESYNHAAAAFREVRRSTERWMLAGQVRALHGLDMAAKMRLGPGISIPEVGYRSKIALRRKMRLLAGYAWTAFRMKALMRQLGKSKSDAEPWITVTRNRYLDHKVVFWSMIASLRLLRPFRQFVASRFTAIAREANSADIQAADIEIVSHCSKEMNKMGMPVSRELELAAMAYDLIGDPINRALLHRASGMQYLNDKNDAAARVEFERMLTLALDCGNAATVLKAALLLYRAGGTLDRDKVRALTKCATGQGYEELAEAVCRLLD